MRLLLKHLIIVNPASDLADTLGDKIDFFTGSELAKIQDLSEQYNKKVKGEDSAVRQQRRAIVAAEICYEALQYCLPEIVDWRWTKWPNHPEMNAKEFILNNSKTNVNSNSYKFVQTNFLPKYTQHLERALLFLSQKKRPASIKSIPKEPLSKIMEAFQKALLNKILVEDKKRIATEIKKQSAEYTSLIEKKWHRQIALEKSLAAQKDD